MKKKLLITGFEPFGKDEVNPSWEAVSRLEDIIGDYELTKLRVPVIFGTAAEQVLSAAETLAPDMILCIGQAGRRKAVTPERVAINLRDASMKDNAGNQPMDEPVAPEGPAAYFASVPVRKMVNAVKGNNIPCEFSYSAGTYVCNDLFYTLRHHYNGTETGVGFIHVPYLPEQAPEGAFSMPLETIVRALSIAVEVM
ncbi:MAG: pyroglutamyl-peptidase I [Lachnospiraceae bacterium]|uniref:pyroglutamyl-peptidase I n=1 Tax=uncultured Acetatifactor sp. TaxID=1671927 RepID=UPI0026132F98|nr:pyroglutamyl-peptidase I [uncultured Acetatifactor sp.]MCI8787946.1 pyroglutamyl-peptidase I [Lachnospiraceae bacterium]